MRFYLACGHEWNKKLSRKFAQPVGRNYLFLIVGDCLHLCKNNLV